MATTSMAKKHKEIIKKIIAALVLSLLMAAFILAFRNDVLPDVSEGDAFDTVYAISE